MKNTAFFAAIEQSKVPHFDVIGLDACSMGMIEIAYELTKTTSYLAVSEDRSDVDAWPYDAVARTLIDRPTQTARELAVAMVDGYASKNAGGQTIVCALDSAKVVTLGSAMKSFSGELTRVYASDAKGVKDVRKLLLAGDNLQRADLGSCAKGFAKMADLSLQKAASAVLQTFEAARIARKAATGAQNLSGLSIDFPTKGFSAKAYDELKFGQASGWSDFLRTFNA
jgi:hypothetical protein